jgi:hypothetical protein
MNISPASLPNETSRKQALAALLEAAIVVQASKTMPPSRIKGDWQQVETTYSTVNPELFKAWQQQALRTLHQHYPVKHRCLWEFEQICHFPNFLELLEGLRYLKKLLAEEANHPGLSEATTQPLALKQRWLLRQKRSWRPQSREPANWPCKTKTH